MFVDEVRVFARSGHGGKGCVAFRREKFRPKGGPDGGNGGRGGNVILQADHDLNNLIGQYYQPRLIAQNGEAGLGKGMDGHAGKDLIVKVPCGTLVWRLPATSQPTEAGSPAEEVEGPVLMTSSSRRPLLRSARGETAVEIDVSAEDMSAPRHRKGAPKGELILDLTENGQQFVLCQGGRGGLGNRNFATAARQTPRFAQPGEPGAACPARDPPQAPWARPVTGPRAGRLQARWRRRSKPASPASAASAAASITPDGGSGTSATGVHTAQT